MLLTGGKANRKSRNSGECLLMPPANTDAQEVLIHSVFIFGKAVAQQKERAPLKRIFILDAQIKSC